MIENRHPILANFDPLPAGGGEARWAGDGGPAEGRGKRILVVEDEQPLRACLRMMLELEGHRVTEAGNGAEALNLFHIGEFDLVITDLEMPVMPGNQLAGRIKLLAPALPILMVSGSGKARRDAKNPVDALLSKPFTVADLRRVLRDLFAAQSEPAQPSLFPALESHSVAFASEEQMVVHLPA